MADINKLKDKIKSTIYPNGKGAINASDHQAMLLDMADGMAETDTKLATLSAEITGVVFSELITSNAQKIYAPLSESKSTKFVLVNEGDAPISFGLSFKSPNGATTLKTIEIPSIGVGESYIFEIEPLQNYSYIYSYSFASGIVRMDIYSDSSLKQDIETIRSVVEQNTSRINVVESSLDEIEEAFTEEVSYIPEVTGVLENAYLNPDGTISSNQYGWAVRYIYIENDSKVSYKASKVGNIGAFISDSIPVIGKKYDLIGFGNTALLEGTIAVQGGSYFCSTFLDTNYVDVEATRKQYINPSEEIAEVKNKIDELRDEIIGENVKVFSDLITANAQIVYAPLREDATTTIVLQNEGANIAGFGLSFRNDTQTIQTFDIPSLKSGESYTLEVPYIANYAYIKVYSFTQGNVRIDVYGDSISQRIEKIESQLKEQDTNSANTNSILMENGILLIGASFADANENNWFELASERFADKSFFNKAVGSTNVMYDAWRLKNGTLYTAEEWEQFDVLMIDHVHDKDVFELKDIVVNGKTFTGSQLSAMSASDYESNGIIDYFAALVYDANVGMDRELYYGYREAQYYAAAYDYIFKKYRALCYAEKDDSSSQWYNSPFGKPCQVVLLTHWNDGRPTINKSLAKLGAKWNSLVVNLSLALGFAPSRLLLDSTRQFYNESTYYARDNEYVDNQYYGKHLQFTTSAPYPYIQRKIASIVAKIVA